MTTFLAFRRAGAVRGVRVVLAALLTGGSAQATGIVSRSCAPVGAQESISVDWRLRPHVFRTSSSHYRFGFLVHTVGTEWERTWRSYAGHLGREFWYGYVRGEHYEYRFGFYVYLGASEARDCNLDEWGMRS